jgi:nucleoside-diphosphate-sugar epimerase
VLHPGNLVGIRLNSAATFSPEVLSRLARGEEVLRPKRRRRLGTTLRDRRITASKKRRLLGYATRYGSLEAVQESVRWLAENGMIETRQ